MFLESNTCFNMHPKMLTQIHIDQITLKPLTLREEHSFIIPKGVCYALRTKTTTKKHASSILRKAQSSMSRAFVLKMYVYSIYIRMLCFANYIRNAFARIFRKHICLLTGGSEEVVFRLDPKIVAASAELRGFSETHDSMCVLIKNRIT